jgi:hypothetical protein
MLAPVASGPLTGRVEVDECYLGGLEEGLPGRLNLERALVVVAAQEVEPGLAAFVCATWWTPPRPA